ncbi:excinuclease ABC subunit UvrA [Mycoplasma iguanae]|uniref:UvrABC system protein A n=1 Tax=Mycoplasma iguanae TaxID=292461 RepID=A0ABY5R9M7_9MOLU|nr:excinuclease ABC subunit UvrA [Mycoplasma iguanae]UVD81695.1 excinuclease ABC subunit UvrA [Mycoplasma iguanae]
MNDNKDFITVKGAKENNLKNIDVKIPKNKLVVLTGVSGSGKSSLAFNTIYEEGRRRYVDSLSSYARQFLGGTKKPLVESIEGLSPAISIEQKTTHNNPRSTVGTVTEIYDYLRLFYSRVGKAFCPKHKTEITAQKTKDILNSIFQLPENSKLLIVSPIVIGEKGTHQNVLEKLKREGFLRVKIGEDIFNLDDEINLEKNKKHNISIVVDRIVLTKENKNRIFEAVEVALNYSKGLVDVDVVGGKTLKFSQANACEKGDFDMPKIETKMFSFNSPYGMCEVCKGIGLSLRGSFDLMVPDKNLSINEGALKIFGDSVNGKSIEWQEFDFMLNYYEIDKNKSIEEMTKRELDIIKYGSHEELTFTLESQNGNKYTRTRVIEGIINKIERKYLETSSEDVRNWYTRFMSTFPCDECNGARLNQYALAVKIGKYNIFEICNLPIDQTLDYIEKIELNKMELEIASVILNEIKQRLSFLVNVGLDYISLNRKAETLSGGEAQRIRLATQIGSNLTGVLYVLDEPSIGLHQKDNQKLIQSLKHMVEIGNTLLVVEHDEETIWEAEHIIDIGPKAGDEGGQLIAQGTVEDIMKNPQSLTGKYLSREIKIEIPKSRRSGNGQNIIIKGAEENNLKNVDVNFPLGKFIAVTGVSGSGKSTLVNEILTKGISKKLSDASIIPGKHREISGLYNIDKLIQISQSPIGRTPRSNPATYTTVFDDIRDVFANTEEARARGYLKGRFSFNVNGGRCDKCQGDGLIKIEMHFLPDVYVVCDHCEGTRYKKETLDIKYRGKSIADILDMRVSEAYDFFSQRAKIKDKLKTIIDVGLGYIKLGQSATTLSGGEAQRIKLATYLQKKPTGKTMYVLDEPTTGLHAYDVHNLLNVLKRIVDNKDTIVVIEHNLDVIKCADYIIDLGQGGGVNGGNIIATGTPEQVAQNPNSFTGQFLKGILNDSK